MIKVKVQKGKINTSEIFKEMKTIEKQKNEFKINVQDVEKEDEYIKCIKIGPIDIISIKLPNQQKIQELIEKYENNDYRRKRIDSIFMVDYKDFLYCFYFPKTEHFVVYMKHTKVDENLETCTEDYVDYTKALKEINYDFYNELLNLCKSLSASF